MGETVYLVDGTSALAASPEAKHSAEEHPTVHIPGFERVVQVDFTAHSDLQLDEAFNPGPTIGESLSSTPTPTVDDEPEQESIHHNNLPPTTLNPQVVKEMLRDQPGVDFEQRVKNLIAYAWQSSSIVERTIPSELYAYAIENPGEWYVANAKRVKQLIDERTGLLAIYERTDEYVDRSPFLRNAASIHDTADNRGRRHEGLQVEISARLIVIEALDRWSDSQHDDN